MIQEVAGNLYRAVAQQDLPKLIVFTRFLDFFVILAYCIFFVTLRFFLPITAETAAV